jgi:hypothetical protein
MKAADMIVANVSQGSGQDVEYRRAIFQARRLWKQASATQRKIEMIGVSGSDHLRTKNHFGSDEVSMDPNCLKCAHPTETEIDALRLAFQLAGGKPQQGHRKDNAGSGQKRHHLFWMSGSLSDGRFLWQKDPEG